MSAPQYVSEQDLAERFGLTLRQARDLRIKHKWPHMRFGRFGIRYTQSQVAAIEDLMTVRAKGKQGGGIPGQTSGSAARSA